MPMKSEELSRYICGINKDFEILTIAVFVKGNSMRLMERARPNVLSSDLNACHAYANGLAAAAEVRCPVLTIMGARDIMAPPRNAQALIAALKEPRAVSLSRCGHAIMAEEPDAVLDALRAFL